MKNLLITLLFILSAILTVTIVQDTKKYESLLQKYKVSVIDTRVMKIIIQKVLKDKSLNRKSIPFDDMTITSHKSFDDI